MLVLLKAMVKLVTNKLRLWRLRFSTWLRESLFGKGFDHVRIESEVIADICEMAAGSWPQEMIAFLTGSVRKEKKDGTSDIKRVLVIDGLYIKGYYADTNSTHFTTHDLPLTGVQGTVHSHPGNSNRPSRADKILFSRFGWFHLIICRPYTREAIATYNKQGERIDTIAF